MTPNTSPLPLVSIAIPAYKTKFLSASIQSVLSQTYRNIELIVVNDHSPENVKDVVSNFRDERLHYYVNEINLGSKTPAENWNKCLSYAKGEYFALLCDDDSYEPTFIADMLELANRFKGVSVFRARADVIDAQGNRFGLYASSPEWEAWDDYLWHVCKGYRTQTISEWFYCTEAIRRCEGFSLLPMAWYADYLSIFRFAKAGGIASVNKILVHFRQSGENISSRDTENITRKVQATNLFYDAVADLLNGHAERDALLLLLCKLLKQHLRYHLGLAPKKQIIRMFFQRKNLHVGGSLLWHAFWHHK